MTKPKFGERCGGRTPVGPLPDGTRLRVVQLLATGTNGGAQESVVSTMLRLDPSRHEAHVISLSHGSTMARLQRMGYATEVIEEPSDERSAELLADRLIALSTQVLHAHMYRAEVVGVAALDIVEQRTGHRPYMVSTVHSSRFRSPADRELLQRITPKINRLIAVSDAIVDKLVAEGATPRQSAASITASTWNASMRRPVARRFVQSSASPPVHRSRWSWGALSQRRGIRHSLRPGRWCTITSHRRTFWSLAKALSVIALRASPPRTCARRSAVPACTSWGAAKMCRRSLPLQMWW